MLVSSVPSIGKIVTTAGDRLKESAAMALAHHRTTSGMCVPPRCLADETSESGIQDG
jgi:hypothetical protein